MYLSLSLIFFTKLNSQYILQPLTDSPPLSLSKTWSQRFSESVGSSFSSCEGQPDSGSSISSSPFSSSSITSSPTGAATTTSSSSAYNSSSSSVPTHQHSGDTLSTVGVDISQMTLSNGQREVVFNTWDFGGQVSLGFFLVGFLFS